MNRWKKPLTIVVFALLLVVVPLTALAASPFARWAHPGLRAHRVAYIASIEGVTPAALRQDLSAGETLLQISGGKYASADALATALLARVQTKLNRAVAAGLLSSVRAHARYARLHARIAQLVTTPHPIMAMMKHARGVMVIRRPLKRLILRTFAASCKTTTAVAKTAIRAGGQTPLAICQATNPDMSKDMLVGDLASAVKTRLDAAAVNHPILATHESRILARVTQRLDGWVTITLPVRI